MLGYGGMLPFLHRALTAHVLRQAGFVPTVRRIVAETSTWADWYRWTHHPAQATTPARPDALPIDPAAAAQACAEQLRDYLHRIETGFTVERLVWLGLAFHLVQDLAVHQGRTDPEHGLQALLWVVNPDFSPAGIRRGKAYSRRLTEALPRLLGSAASQDLRTNTGVRVLTAAERQTVLGPPDFRWLSLLDLVPQALRYLKQRNPAKRVRWDSEAVLRRGLSF